MENIYNDIISILENMGYVVFEKNEDDFSISDYIGDSIRFIHFIISIEEKYSIELSDDFLDFNLLSSAKGLSNKISAFYQTFYENEHKNFLECVLDNKKT